MIQLLAIAVIVLAGQAAASPWARPAAWYWNYPYYAGYPGYAGYHGYKAPYHYDAGFPYAGPHAQLVYNGEFDGSCKGKADGLYFVDDSSFAFCAHQQKTIQACPAGTRNPAHSEFKKGAPAHFYQFCSVIQDYQPSTRHENWHNKQFENSLNKENAVGKEVEDNIFDSVYEEGFEKVFKEN